MRHQTAITFLTLSALLMSAAAGRAQESDFFDPEFSNWLGAKEYWSYKEGVLIATAPKGVTRTGPKTVGTPATFLVSKKAYGDFELSFKVRVGRKALSTTAGVQIRSTLVDRDNFQVTGPRVLWGESGSIYGEKIGRGYVKKVSKLKGALAVDERDFIDYFITAVGKRVTVKFGGVTTIDETFSQLPASGVIALHMGGHTSSDYLIRDIHFRDLSKDAKVTVKPAIKEPANPALPRYSADAAELLAGISAPYWLDNRDVPAGDMKSATRLIKATDPKVRELAKMAVDLYALAQMRTEQGRKTLAALQTQVEIGAPLAFAKRIASGDTNPGAAKIIEDLMGDKVQDEFNKVYLLTYLGMDQSAKLRGKLQALAEAKTPQDIAVMKPVAVYCETSPETLGTITFRNDSGRTLRHVLALGRVAVNAEAARAAGEAEDAIGRDVLPALGFAKETVKGSRLAGELRNLAAQIDPGTVVYIPEMRPGSSVRVFVAHARSLVHAKSADVSIFSDELTIVRQRPSNFFEAQITAKYPPHKNVLLKK